MDKVRSTKTLTFKTCYYDGSSIDSIIEDLLYTKNRILELHPEATNIHLNVDTVDSYGSSYSELSIAYTLPLTAEEMRKEQDRVANLVVLKRKKEFEEYIKLKARFEGKNGN